MSTVTDTALSLKAAIGTYDHTRPLKDGSVGSDRLTLDLGDITPINRAFTRTVNELAFDVSELAIVTYLLARAAGRPLVGVPVVLQRLSPFASVRCHAASGIGTARDLEGRRVGASLAHARAVPPVRGRAAGGGQAVRPSGAPVRPASEPRADRGG